MACAWSWHVHGGSQLVAWLLSCELLIPFSKLSTFCRKDPVHGHCDLRRELKPFIDSKVFQRLRHLKQLGLTHLIYPGARCGQYTFAEYSTWQYAWDACHACSLLSRHIAGRQHAAGAAAAEAGLATLAQNVQPFVQHLMAHAYILLVARAYGSWLHIPFTQR